MAILGLTDSTPSFKEIGRLRLGAPKGQMLQEIGYFRSDFRPDAQDAAVKFVGAYGKEPTSINFRLPFREIDRCWDAFYEVYNTSGMLGKSDGERWLYLRDNKTGELLVSDGVPLRPGAHPVDSNGNHYMPFDKNIPVYSYTAKSGKNAGKDIGVYARPTGRLKIFIPELQQAGFVVIITHSIYNISRLSGQFAGILEIAKAGGVILPAVPMVISRRMEQISVSFSGKKTYQDHYLLNIEISPAWMQAQFAFLDRMLPGTTAQPTTMLPEFVTTPTPYEISEADETEEILDAPPLAPSAAPMGVQPPAPSTAGVSVPQPATDIEKTFDDLGARLWPGVWASKRTAILAGKTIGGDMGKALEFCETRRKSLTDPAKMRQHIAASWSGYEGLIDKLKSKWVDWDDPLPVIRGIARVAELVASGNPPQDDDGMISIIVGEMEIPAF